MATDFHAGLVWPKDKDNSVTPKSVISSITFLFSFSNFMF